jgi:hypothetical protein
VPEQAEWGEAVSERHETIMRRCRKMLRIAWRTMRPQLGLILRDARCAPQDEEQHEHRTQFGQIYPVPAGDLKQPTDSGMTCLGSHSTTFGK